LYILQLIGCCVIALPLLAFCCQHICSRR
jgi:hypothetical protein